MLCLYYISDQLFTPINTRSKGQILYAGLPEKKRRSNNRFKAYCNQRKLFGEMTNDGDDNDEQHRQKIRRLTEELARVQRENKRR